jgi:hypothetical protein
MREYVGTYIQDYIQVICVKIYAESLDEAEYKFEDYLQNRQAIGIIFNEHFVVRELKYLDEIE